MSRELSERDQDRFWSKVALPNEQGCMLWLDVPGAGGYGQMRLNGKARYAHRLSYMFNVGEIPVGLELDHLCRVRRCVAPGHLEAVSRRVNILRGQGASAINAVRTHCKHGHAFDAANTYVTSRGVRQCRACKRNRQRIYTKRPVAA
ncbi:HNH endonuclease signature motif containing protein [Streptomyces cinereoruber]|uniref:HNH endonuclease signature motif containing protein n=1 Tax=Streptomyces cinereoruber TaxID=67260 RepID=UPI003654A0EF